MILLLRMILMWIQLRYENPFLCFCHGRINKTKTPFLSWRTLLNTVVMLVVMLTNNCACSSQFLPNC